MYFKFADRLSKQFFSAFLFFIVIVGGLPGTAAPVSAAGQWNAPKVIVYVVDDLDVRDLTDAKLVNFRKVVRNGALGLMNTKSGNLITDNRSSSYLTISLGKRVAFPDFLPRVINQQPVAETGLFNLVTSNTKEINDRLYTGEGKKPQIFGDVVRNNGKTLGLIAVDKGNERSDYASLLTFNSTGQLGIGNVNPGPEHLEIFCRKAVQLTDVLFVNFGETTGFTAEQALKRADNLLRTDHFLGDLLKISDSEKTVLMIVSPMSRSDRMVSGFKNISPVFMYGNGIEQGILTSDTTRRAGLISNIDINPTLLKLTGINPKRYGYVGESMRVIKASDNMNRIQLSYDRFVHLKTTRYIVHGVYVLLLLIFSLIMINGVRKGYLSNRRLLRAVGLMAVCIPAVNLIIPLALLGSLGIESDRLYLDIVLMMAVILAVGVIGSKSINRTLVGMAAASLVTSIFIITDLVTGQGNILNTPLGFNDIFSGGRYYGLNNDSMGILVGSSVFCSFYISERLGFDRIKTFFTVEIFLIAASIALTPGFGANVGGTIAALTTGLVAGILIIGGKGLKTGRFIGSIALVVAIEVLISYTDMLSGSQTHAGKALNALMSGNFSFTLTEILKSKLRVFGAMLVIPPWNIILCAQFLGCLLLCKKQFHNLLAVKSRYPVMSISFMVTFYGGITALIFNDTGVIATSLMLTYLTMPLGVLVADNYNLAEYHSELSQKI